MLFKSKKLIGLDIGTSTIKVAELEVKKKRPVLKGFSMYETPEGTISGGDIHDPENLSIGVQAAISELGTKTKRVSTGLWGSSVILKKISVPRMDPELLREQIRYEAEQYIPYDVNEVNLEYKILDAVSTNPEAMEVLLVAAKQDNVYKYAEVILNAGFDCETLDVAGLALANCFEANYGVVQDQVIGLLNVGAAVTNFVVIENGEVIFCRDVPVGGATYTMELQKALGISAQEAESIKLSLGVGEPAPEEAAGVLNSAHEIFQEEIGGSVDFFVNTSNAGQIAQFFVTGGASSTGGLIESLQSSLRVKCDIFDPFFNIGHDEKNLSPDYVAQVRNYCSVAIGLGLRTVGDA